MKFVPTKDYLLLELVAVQETTSGLVLVRNQPQTPQTIPTMCFAKVLDVGPDARSYEEGGDLDIGFKAGEVIAFPPGAQQVMNDGVKDFYLAKATAVVARVEDFSTTVSVLG